VPAPAPKTRETVELELNGKLRDELLNREIFATLTEAKVLITGWRKEYNHVRPHSAKGYKPPAPEAKMLVTLTL
jgi:transposase InsO family protein